MVNVMVFLQLFYNVARKNFEKSTLPFLIVGCGLLCSFQKGTSTAVPGLRQETREAKLIINNRPLVKIKGKTISLRDVVQKLNLLIKSNYPEYAHQPEALYQIYREQWKATFEELVNAELMVCYGEDKKIIISEAQVREELEHRFGPNVISSLHKFGLSYEDALAIVERGLIVDQMTWYFVYNKAQESVTPEEIKTSYMGYKENFVPQEEWSYQTITIRGESLELCQEIAERVGRMLCMATAGAEAILAAAQKELNIQEKGVTVHASEIQSFEKSAIPKSHLKAMESCPTGIATIPLVEGSSKKPILKLFIVKEVRKELPKSFESLAQAIQDQIFQVHYQKELDTFIGMLKELYGYSDPFKDGQIPSDYIPFQLV